MLSLARFRSYPSNVSVALFPSARSAYLDMVDIGTDTARLRTAIERTVKEQQ